MIDYNIDYADIMEKNLDLLLVNPGNRSQTYGKLSISLSGFEPPIWCGLVAAFVRKHGYSVEIIDADADKLSPESVAEKIVEYSPLLVDIVVLGTNPSASSTPKMTAVTETLEALRNKHSEIKTVLSGLHPSALPERTLKEEKTDYVCRGESFYTILKLIKMLKDEKIDISEIEGLWYRDNGKIVSNSKAEAFKNLDELPFAAWDLLPMDKYRAHNWHCLGNLKERNLYVVIYTSLGCAFKCTYCPVHAFYGKPGIRFRSPENVVKEIDLLVKNYNIKNIKILDELFVFKREKDRIIKLCDLIIERGYKLNIWVYARTDTIDETLLKKMKRAGINWLCFGFESANKEVRSAVGKKAIHENIKRAIDMTHSADINIMANFMFGLPDDNLDTMRETLDMAKKFKFEFINFYVTMAYPGSELYEEALKKGVKLPESWHGYSQLGYETMPMPTKYLSAKEVLGFRDKAFEEYFSNPEYVKYIRERFGVEAEEHIKEMLKYRIKRKLTEEETG